MGRKGRDRRSLTSTPDARERRIQDEARKQNAPAAPTAAPPRSNGPQNLLQIKLESAPGRNLHLIKHQRGPRSGRHFKPLHLY
jgi:hypothetical protein